MDSVTTTAKGAWRSERLIYRQAETEDPELQAWFQEFMVNHPETATLAAGVLLKPRDLTRSTQLLLDAFPQALLGALIYLPAAAAAGAAVTTEDATAAAAAAATATTAATTGGAGNEAPATAKKTKDTLIGFVMLQPLSPWSPHNRNSEVGISIASEFQGRGYGAESMQWAVDWGFRFANLHRISLNTISYNERAIALYKRLGFVEEGRGREAVYFDRKWYDSVNMAILEHEWEALRDKETARPN